MFGYWVGSDLVFCLVARTKWVGVTPSLVWMEGWGLIREYGHLLGEFTIVETIRHNRIQIVVMKLQYHTS